MAAFIDQWVQPDGFLVIFVMNGVISLLSEIVAKGGEAMTTKSAHSLKRFAVAARDTIAPSRVTC